MSGTIAVVNGTLIDGTGGEPLDDAAVFIVQGKVAYAGPSSGLSVPPGVEVIDASGQWILPGIVNGNVHLLDGIMMMSNGGVEYLSRYEGDLVGVIEEAAQISLAAGVTTVFDTWNATGPVLEARNRIAQGIAPGSRVFAAGNIVGMGGPFSPDFNMRARQVISPTFANRLDELFSSSVGAELSVLPPEKVRPIIREYLARGVDMLKIAVSDHLFPVVGVSRGYLTFSERVLRLMVEEARDAGVPVLAHIATVEALAVSLDIGVDIIIHATLTSQEPIPDELIARIVESETVCGVQSVTAAYQAKLDAIQHPFAGYGGGVHIDNEKRLVAAGGKVILTTDAGCTTHDVLTDTSEVGDLERPWTLGSDHVAWARALVEKGMTPMQVIVASTRGPAEAYGKSHLFGSVEAGLLGDLVVLGSDPLSDVNAMGDVVAVIQEGVVVDRTALPLRPLASVPVPGDPR